MSSNLPSSGDIICFRSFPKPNLPGNNNGWNLGVNPKEETFVYNAGQGPWGQWTVIKKNETDYCFKSALGTDKENRGGGKGWHLGVSQQGQVIHNAGQGPLGTFRLVAHPSGKVSLMVIHGLEKKNKSGANGWHITVTPEGDVFGDGADSEFSHFEIVYKSEEKGENEEKEEKEKKEKKEKNSKNEKEEKKSEKGGKGGKSEKSKKNEKSEKDQDQASELLKLITSPSPRLAVVREPSKKVECVFESHSSAPYEVEYWLVFGPAPPPSLPSQIVTSATLTVKNPHNQTVVSVGEIGKLQSSHPIFSTGFEGVKGLKHGIDVSYCVNAQLYSTKLVPYTEPGNVPVANPITPAERSYHLMQTDLINYTDPIVQEFIRNNRLHPNNVSISQLTIVEDDGYPARSISETFEVETQTGLPIEPAIGFAYRVFMFIRTNFKYHYDSKMDRHASHIIKARQTDCGGFAILFSAILRSFAIPTRMLVGRWAATAQDGDGQHHVKCEFYDDHIGWIPVDISSSILFEKEPPYLRNFGKDGGNFITLHVDHGLVIETKHFGVINLSFLQGCAQYNQGGGKCERTITWKVNSS